MSCNHSPTEWEIKFYGGCGRCYVEANQAQPLKPVHGAWSRAASVEKNAFAKDILQPTRKDGTINPHFVQAHGTRSIEKEMKLSKKEIYKQIEKYG